MGYIIAIGQHRQKISQQTKMPSRMPSHNRITKRQKKLIDLFGPENLKKDRVIEKKFAILFGDCRNKERTFLRDVRIKRKYRLLFGEYQEHNNSVKNSRISKNRKKSKQQKARIQKRMEDLFGRENTKKDMKISKKIMYLFGEE